MHFHAQYVSIVVHKTSWPLPDSEVHGANMGPTWVLSAPDGPHVGPVNLAIGVVNTNVLGDGASVPYPEQQKTTGLPRMTWLVYIQFAWIWRQLVKQYLSTIRHIDV